MCESSQDLEQHNAMKCFESAWGDPLNQPLFVWQEAQIFLAENQFFSVFCNSVSLATHAQMQKLVAKNVLISDIFKQ